MTNNAIEQASKLLDSPLAGIVANACGANINNVRSALAKLTNKTAIVKNGQAAIDDISKLRQGLLQLKR